MNSQKTDPESREYPGLNFQPRVLLGPGPSMVHPRVLRAMSAPMIGHLDPYYLEIMDRIQEMLRAVFVTENELTLSISGTGSAAMETAVANFVEPGTSILVCENGYFGGRITEMARRYQADVSVIRRPWGKTFSPEEIESALREKPAQVVALVHAETSTGVAQPLGEISRVVHQAGALLLVDAVSSLGGVPLRVDELSIDICYSGSQKCLSAPPGLGPITIGPRALEALESRRSPVANWYLDLTLLRKYWGPERLYHHTAPISANFALYEALRLVLVEGLEARWERHRRNAVLLWDGLQEMGLELFAPEAVRLPPLTTVLAPEGVDEAAIRSALLKEYGIEIAGGLGDLKGKAWRIGLMGYSCRQENILLLLEALKRLLKR